MYFGVDFGCEWLLSLIFGMDAGSIMDWSYITLILVGVFSVIGVDFGCVFGVELALKLPLSSLFGCLRGSIKSSYITWFYRPSLSIKN